MSQQNSLIEEHESGLIENILFVTKSTWTCHILTKEEETACGWADVLFDRVFESDSGRIMFGVDGLGNPHYDVIHRDCRRPWVKTKHSLCSNCNEIVDDYIQSELFDESVFSGVDGLTTEVALA